MLSICPLQPGHQLCSHHFSYIPASPCFVWQLLGARARSTPLASPEHQGFSQHLKHQPGLPLQHFAGCIRSPQHKAPLPAVTSKDAHREVSSVASRALGNQFLTALPWGFNFLFKETGCSEHREN